MHTNIEQRACDLAVYIIENKSTVRAAAAQFGISKSTVHKDITERLVKVNPALYRQVRELLDLNKAERHIRGGLAACSHLPTAARPIQFHCTTKCRGMVLFFQPIPGKRLKIRPFLTQKRDFPSQHGKPLFTGN